MLNGQRMASNNAPPVPELKEDSSAQHANDPETKAEACLLPDKKTGSSNLQLYRLYFSADIKAVCSGKVSCLVEESSNKITTPTANGSSTPYYWRIDTVLANGNVLEGRVWST